MRITMKFLKTRFNERKATQVAARFLALADREMPYISLIKLMYFTDREALLRWGSPLTNDAYYSLDKGPILSTVMDLIVDGPQGAAQSVWAEHISGPHPSRTIRLEAEPGTDELSDAEDELIGEVFRKYGNWDRWKLVEFSHTLPEWVNPEGSSLPIEIEDILKKGGKSDEEVALITDDLENTRMVHSLFSAR
jgi:uncharacterized phage-associated protein